MFVPTENTVEAQAEGLQAVAAERPDLWEAHDGDTVLSDLQELGDIDLAKQWIANMIALDELDRRELPPEVDFIALSKADLDKREEILRTKARPVTDMETRIGSFVFAYAARSMQGFAFVSTGEPETNRKNVVPRSRLFIATNNGVWRQDKNAVFNATHRGYLRYCDMVRETAEGGDMSLIRGYITNAQHVLRYNTAQGQTLDELTEGIVSAKLKLRDAFPMSERATSVQDKDLDRDFTTVGVSAGESSGGEAGGYVYSLTEKRILDVREAAETLTTGMMGIKAEWNGELDRYTRDPLVDVALFPPPYSQPPHGTQIDGDTHCACAFDGSPCVCLRDAPQCACVEGLLSKRHRLRAAGDMLAYEDIRDVLALAEFIGWSMTHAPDREFLAEIGAPGSGKTTRLRALEIACGEYAYSSSLSRIIRPLGGFNGEMANAGSPVRVMLLDESAMGFPSAKDGRNRDGDATNAITMLNDLTGGAVEVFVRDVYEKGYTVTFNASIVVSGNPAPEGQTELGLDPDAKGSAAEALMERVRFVVPKPIPVEDRIPTLKRDLANASPALRTALMNRVIDWMEAMVGVERFPKYEWMEANARAAAMKEQSASRREFLQYAIAPAPCDCESEAGRHLHACEAFFFVNDLIAAHKEWVKQVGERLVGDATFTDMLGKRLGLQSRSGGMIRKSDFARINKRRSGGAVGPGVWNWRIDREWLDAAKTE